MKTSDLDSLTARMKEQILTAIQNETYMSEFPADDPGGCEGCTDGWCQSAVDAVCENRNRVAEAITKLLDEYIPLVIEEREAMKATIKLLSDNDAVRGLAAGVEDVKAGRVTRLEDIEGSPANLERTELLKDRESSKNLLKQARDFLCYTKFGLDPGKAEEGDFPNRDDVEELIIAIDAAMQKEKP